MSKVQERGFAAQRRSRDEFVPLSDFAERARFEINEAGRFLMEHGALSPNRSFNAGVRLPGEEKFVLGGFTPRGEEMAPAAVIGFDGTYYQGKVKKNHLELLEVYASVFRERSHVNAAIHTHSAQIEAYALSHKPLPIVFDESLLDVTCEPIPLIPFAPRHSAAAIVESVREHRTAPAIIIANHGPFFWGTDIPSVARLIIKLEETAQVATKAHILGGARLIIDEDGVRS